MCKIKIVQLMWMVNVQSAELKDEIFTDVA